MECPKGYQMGSNGVCQQVGGYARGGMSYMTGGDMVIQPPIDRKRRHRRRRKIRKGRRDWK